MNDLVRSIEAAALGPLAVAEDRSAERNFCFAESFIGFAGHFPGFPIVPAIVQILTAQVMAETLGGAPLRLQAVEKAKFLIPLRPDQEITVHCCPSADPADLVYRVRLNLGEQLAASFVLRFQTKGLVP